MTQLRKLRDDATRVGFSRELWKEMAELGWAGIVFPEDDTAAADLGFAELGIVLEECGRTLTASPLLSTVALGGTSAMLLGGNETQQKDVLTGVCANGDTRARARLPGAGARHEPHRDRATRAESSAAASC